MSNQPDAKEPRFPSCAASMVFWVSVLSALLCVLSFNSFLVDTSGSIGGAICGAVLMIMLCTGILYYMLRRRFIRINYPTQQRVLGIFVGVAIVVGVILPIAIKTIRCGSVGAGNDLHNCDLDGDDLSGNDLHGANFSGATLNDANLSGANLKGANLSGAELVGANLTGADLSDANASNANMRNTTLNDMVLVGANVFGVDFYDAEGLTVEMIDSTADRRGILLDDWNVILEEAGAVCKGGSLSNAATYGSDDLKPLVILNDSGGRHALSNRPPREWWPSRAAQVGIVVCAGEETSEQVQRCSYSNGGAVTRYRYELDIRVINAATGSLITRQTFQGTMPENCPESIRSSQSLYGSRVSDSEIMTAVTSYVNPDGNLPPISLGSATSDSDD